MRRLYIHAGTHKTATSAIQEALFGLEFGGRASPIYPGVGIPPGLWGHHNLAWQLLGANGYSPEHGGLAALESEFAGSSHDVILSSEDFECLLDGSGRLRPLTVLAEKYFDEHVVILYLRHQSTYIASLYCELLKHGLDIGFRSFRDGVVESGSFTWHHAHFDFDYGRLSAAAADGGQVVLRSYDRIRQEGSIVEDFFSLVRHQASPQNRQSNVRLTFVDSLRLFLTNMAGGHLNDAEEALLRRASTIFGDRLAMASPESARLLNERFFDANRLLEEVGIVLDPAEPSDASNAIELDEPFSDDRDQVVAWLRRACHR